MSAARERIADVALFAGFCLLFAAQVISSVGQKSATFDEPANLVSGYVALRYGDYWLMPESLPLVKLLAASPLLFSSVKVPPAPERWNGDATRRFFDRFLYEANEGDTLLMRGRIAVLPLSLLMGGLVFLWTRQLFGRVAAAFALLLFAFEPNLLAHSGLVHTDLGVACFMFMTVYGLYRLAHGVTPLRLLLTVFAFALALVTKLSMLPLGIIVLVLGGIVCLSAVPVDVRWRGSVRVTLRTPGQKLGGVLLVLLLAGLVTYGLTWAVFRGNYNAVGAGESPSPLAWNEIDPASPLLRSTLGVLRDTKVLPEPYLYNLFYHLRVSGLFPAFLMGEVRQGGWWYYFLVTFLLKTPLPLLVLSGVGLIVLGKTAARDRFGRAFLLVPVLAYFCVISTLGFNIGHRHLLPIYPFVIVLAAAVMPWAIRQRKAVTAGLMGLVAWYVVSSASVYPHYLAYFNELAGGPDNGYKYLVDSNLDWGQDLKGLKRYMERERIERVWLSYFGTAPPEYYGIAYDYLPSFAIMNPQNVRRGPAGLDRLPALGGTVAISATNLQEVYLPFFGLKKGYFESYRRLRPVAKIGYSIFVYRFEAGPAAGSP